MATIDLGAIRFNWRGAYANGTAYVANDVVSFGGASYINILASTGIAVSTVANWSIMSSAGTDGTDVGATITTQGDLLYRDGSGPARLAKGTGFQTLRMNTGATAPEWAVGVGLDTAQNWTKGQRGEITALTSSATITPDMADSNNFSVTLAHNASLANPTNLTAGQSGSIFITQDGTGSRTLAYGTQWDFVGGAAPTLTTTAAGIDRLDYVVRTTSSIHTVASLALS